MGRNELKQWIVEGKTQSEIARLLNVSRQRVSQMMRTHNLVSLYREQKEKQRFAAVEERRQKFGCKDQVDKIFYSELRRRFRVKKANSKRLGIKFDLEFTDIVWNTRCPLLDEPLDYFSNRGMWAPSFDRIDPRKGYVKGNVWIISKRANAIKRDYTPEEVPEFFARINEIITQS